MTYTMLEWAGVILIGLGISLILVPSNWRVQLGGLTLQYLGGFILFYAIWPLNLAVIKLISGWMAGAILGISSGRGVEIDASMPRLTQSIYRLLAVLLIGIGAASQTEALILWLPQLPLLQAWSGIFLMGTALLMLGIFHSAYRNTLSILTFLLGFELIFAPVERSTVVIIGLAALTLAASMLGAALHNIEN